jgi:hypothetical protein
MGEGVRRSAPGRASTRRTRSDHTRGPVTAFRLRQRCPVRARRSESSAIRVWRCRKHTTAGKRDDSSAPRDQFAPTQRRRYSAKVSFSYAPRSPSPCPPRLPALFLLLTHARLRLTHAAAAASLKSLHLSALRRKIPPQTARAHFSRPSSRPRFH